MFTKRIVVFLFFVLSFVTFMTVRLLRIGAEDYQKYEKLIKSSESEEEKLEGKEYTARQQRGRVQKEIRFMTDNNRLHHSLRSRQSELVFSVQGEHSEMVENMSGVSCFLQEEVFYRLPDGREALLQGDGRLLLRHADPQESFSWISLQDPGIKPMQKLRFLEADKAVYYYKTNSFVAKEVKLQRFVVEGHELLQNIEGFEPTMKGVAQAVEFTLAGKDLNFRAHHLKAKFFSPEGLL